MPAPTPLAWHNGSEESVSLTCAICEKRKPKRFCPALHGRICPPCCGESREVTLDCPRECVYLQQAREHEKPRPLEDLDQAALFPQIQIGERFIYEQEHLLLGLSFAMGRAARSDATVKDADLIAALSSLAKTYETFVNSGLHYGEAMTSVGQQSIATELQNMVKEYREAEQKNTGVRRLRDSEVLYALVFLLRMAYRRSNGRPKSRAFLDFLFSQFPEKPSRLAGDEPGRRIIMP
jgi:hypothetical protein